MARAFFYTPVDLGAGTAFGSETDSDTLIGIENVTGGSGADVLTGDAGVNVLSGGSGNDTLAGGAGGDTLDGEAGIDTVDYSTTSLGVTADLEAGTASGTEIGTDTLLSIENLVGGSGDDVLIGDVGANILSGGAGNDTLTGGTGSDTLEGGAGNDSFVYNAVVDLGDLIDGFDASGADEIDLDALLDGLGVADIDRSSRVDVQQAGTDQNAVISIDTTGDAVFDTVVATVTSVTGDLDQNDLNLDNLV